MGATGTHAFESASPLDKSFTKNHKLIESFPQLNNPYRGSHPKWFHLVNVMQSIFTAANVIHTDSTWGLQKHMHLRVLHR